MPERVRRPAGVDTIVGLGSNLLSLLLTAVTGIILARSLGPSGKGTVSLIVLVATQLAWSFSLGVELSLLHYGGDPARSLRKLASACVPIALPLSATATLAAIALLHFPLSESVPPAVRPAVYAGMGVIPALFFAGYLNALLRASGRMAEAQASIAFLAVWGLTGALVGSALGLSLSGFVVLAVLGMLIGTSAPYVFAWRAGIFPPERSSDRPLRALLVRYGIKGHLGTVLQGLNYRLDVFLVAALLSSADVGLYTVAMSAGEALLIVPNVLGFVITHRSALPDERTTTAVTEAATRLTASVLLVAAVAFVLVGKQVITGLFGDDFTPSYDALVYLLPGIWSLAIWMNLTNDLVGRGHPWVRSQTAAAAVVVTIVLDIVLIPQMGINGAALASSCAYATAMIFALERYARITHRPGVALLFPRTGDVALLRSALRNATAHLRSRMA